MSEAEDIIGKSEHKLAIAKMMFTEEEYEETASSAYYSMFHAARAALSTEESYPKTHSGTVSEIGKLFKNRIDTSLLSEFSTIQTLREDADYEVEPDRSSNS